MILPPPDQASLLLDLDGTLLDIAPTPDSVIVPPDLPLALRALHTRLGGALAIVTGRPVEQVDALLPGTIHAIAGEHGGAIRRHQGAPLARPDLPDLPQAIVEAAAAIAARHPGTILERKRRGFVFHFRQAPDHGPALEQHARTLAARLGPAWQLLPALMAWEIRPHGADKGAAVRALSAHPPFAGRRPIFIGDDVTDEDGMEAARALGGAGLRVEPVFGTPAAVRAWLTASAAAAPKTWPPFPKEIPPP